MPELSSPGLSDAGLSNAAHCYHSVMGIQEVRAEPPTDAFAGRVRSGVRWLGAADQALYAAVAATPTPLLDEPVRRLSQAANFSRIWLSIAIGLAVLGGPDGRRTAVRGTLAVGVTSATVNLGIKFVHPRKRPDRAASRVPLARQVTMPSSTSFPSGHSAAGFAFASCVGQRLPRAAPPLLALAAAVAYSRVYTGVHFPSDVIIGSAVGAAIGRAVARLT
jgi:membrane-associated phospholipid phosphatase